MYNMLLTAFPPLTEGDGAKALHKQQQDRNRAEREPAARLIIELAYLK
jgi:hypothetical protein